MCVSSVFSQTYFDRFVELWACGQLIWRCGLAHTNRFWGNSVFGNDKRTNKSATDFMEWCNVLASDTVAPF